MTGWKQVSIIRLFHGLTVISRLEPRKKRSPLTTPHGKDRTRLENTREGKRPRRNGLGALIH